MPTCTAPPLATGCASAIPAGAAVSFEPDEWMVYGGNRLIDGKQDDAAKKQQALGKLSEQGIIKSRF
jgi:urease beta subunit